MNTKGGNTEIRQPESTVQNGRMELAKIWNLEVQFWVPLLKAIGITEKSNMKMG